MHVISANKVLIMFIGLEVSTSNADESDTLDKLIWITFN